MTGPEHYVEAEKWRQALNTSKDRTAAMECLALAQYHATMADVAVSALGVQYLGRPSQAMTEEYRQWRAVLNLE